MSLTIYHNPRCSKSRQTLALIEDAGVTPTIVKYLDDNLTVDELRDLLQKLNMKSPQELMRKGETIYKSLDLKSETNEDTLLEAMVAHPKLIERPIVVSGGKAVLGRPPENVNALLS